MSIVYNLIVLIVCWVFYTVMTNVGTERQPQREARDAARSRAAASS